MFERGLLPAQPILGDTGRSAPGRATSPGARSPLARTTGEAPSELVFDERPEVTSAKRVAQLAEGLGLDLTDALPRDREALADLFQRVLAFLADAEPQAQDFLLL